MSILDFITVVSFGLTCFSIGYTFGKDNHKAQKQPPQSGKLSGNFCQNIYRTNRLSVALFFYNHIITLPQKCQNFSLREASVALMVLLRNLSQDCHRSHFSRISIIVFILPFIILYPEPSSTHTLTDSFRSTAQDSFFSDHAQTNQSPRFYLLLHIQLKLHFLCSLTSF